MKKRHKKGKVQMKIKCQRTRYRDKDRGINCDKKRKREQELNNWQRGIEGERVRETNRDKGWMRRVKLKDVVRREI